MRVQFTSRSGAILGLLTAVTSTFASADSPEPVTVQSFPRAESHPIEKQDIIRMNRDTLYSSGVFDLDAGPVTIVLPDTDGRFMSLLIINEDHYTEPVTYAPGRFTFTRDAVGMIPAHASHARPSAASVHTGARRMRTHTT